MASALPYRRPAVATLAARLAEPRRFMQVVSGPRQVGKTTLVEQALAATSRVSHYASADDPGLRDTAWLRAQWELGRLRAREAGPPGAVLALDEIQKVPGWSDLVKLLWDQDTRSATPLRVVLLGSAPLVVARGLTESLAGRFELIRLTHWSYPEMHQAFGWDLDTFIYFGGYPGSAALAGDRERWARYVLDSLVETTISRDVLLLSRIDKPALLRQLFRLCCDYSGQILPYRRMLGDLLDAGNTTTLAHYLELLSQAGLVTGLPKHSMARIRQRGSSPKLLPLNTALVSAHLPGGLRETRSAHEIWGRLVETAVGAHLLNTGAADGIELAYWRERDLEVDFVLRRGGAVLAVEVASGARPHGRSGLAAFQRAHPSGRTLLFGTQGVPLGEVLSRPAVSWFTAPAG